MDDILFMVFTMVVAAALATALAAIRVFRHLPKVLFWRKDWDWLHAAIAASVDEAIKRDRKERGAVPPSAPLVGGGELRPGN